MAGRASDELRLLLVALILQYETKSRVIANVYTAKGEKQIVTSNNITEQLRVLTMLL